MNLDEAKTLLNLCTRDELRDHAFGDREVSWTRKDKNGKTLLVADGYFGGSGVGVGGVSILGPEDENGQMTTIASFDGKEATELAKCGADVHIERNDSTGPDTYADGKCMPGLTLEGVLKELTGK